MIKPINYLLSYVTRSKKTTLTNLNYPHLRLKHAKHIFLSVIVLLVVLIPLVIYSLKNPTGTIKKLGFTDVLSSSGINRTLSATGISWTDYNQDGLLDLFLAGAHYENSLYKNVGQGKFIEATYQTGLTKSLSNKGRARNIFMGVFGDYNNDGCSDLYLSIGGTSKGQRSDQLWRNNCNETFTEASIDLGERDDSNGLGAAWADYDNDGFLDIYVANRGDNTSESHIFQENFLYRNNGNETFTNVTKKAGVLGSASCSRIEPSGMPSGDDWAKNIKTVGGPLKQSFQPIWFDYDNNNFLDLFVTVENGVSPLYKNNGDGTFSDVTEISGLCRWGTGMGVTAGDYNNDGFLDLYVTNVTSMASFLWSNLGNGTFREVSGDARVSNFSFGWGTSFIDYDNDGYLDLYVVNGTEGGEIEVRRTIPRIMKDKLFKNNGSDSFEDFTLKEGISLNLAKEALAVADYNNDGYQDIFVASSHTSKIASFLLYKNNAGLNNWITIKLQGTKSNRDGVGARITIKSEGKIQIREVVSGSSFLSQSSLWQTFGLGNKTKHIESVIIRWPSGSETNLKNIPVNQILAVTE